MKVAHRSFWIDLALLTLLLLTALTCFHVGPAHASIDFLRVIPPSPSDHDSVVVEFAGTFFDGCWHFQYGTCGQSAPDSFLIEAYISDSWQPRAACPTMLSPYWTTCVLDPLPPGTYTVIATQHGESFYRSEHEQKTIQFTVTTDVPAVPATWSGIKARY